MLTKNYINLLPKNRLTQCLEDFNPNKKYFRLSLDGSVIVKCHNPAGTPNRLEQVFDVQNNFDDHLALCCSAYRYNLCHTLSGLLVSSIFLNFFHIRQYQYECPTSKLTTKLCRTTLQIMPDSLTYLQGRKKTCVMHFKDQNKQSYKKYFHKAENRNRERDKKNFKAWTMNENHWYQGQKGYIFLDWQKILINAKLYS